MLTTDQADHFRTSGFAVLSGYLADRVGVLRAGAGWHAADGTACAASSSPPTLRSAHDGVEQAFRGFDSGRYPDVPGALEVW
jgi:hypothetical protein